MDTSGFGWPISAPVKRVGSKTYVEARETLRPYGYFNAKQCKKGAYKQLEDFLKQFGLKESDIYLEKNSKSFISAEAFILTFIAGSKLRDATVNGTQWSQLCVFFAETVVSTTFARGIADRSASRTLNAAASSTPNLTQVTSVETVSTQDTSKTVPYSKVYKGCVKPHEATSVLAKRLEKGQISRSTQLEERVKKQRKVLIELAQEVHHGSKIDLLHGISVAVGRRFREESHSDSIWQGLLEKEDIIELTKLVRTKRGGSLYTKIAEE